MFSKKIIVLIVCLVSLQAFAKMKQLSFSLDSFLREFVETNHQQAFADFYKNLIFSKRHLSKEERSKSLDLLAQEGKAALQIQAPGYFEQLTKTAHAKDQRTTFVRFGAYQDFQKQEIKGMTRFVAKARSYINGARTKM